MKLYNEVYKCIMCGRPPREPKRSVVVEETIDGKSISLIAMDAR